MVLVPWVAFGLPGFAEQIRDAGHGGRAGRLPDRRHARPAIVPRRDPRLRFVRHWPASGIEWPIVERGERLQQTCRARGALAKTRGCCAGLRGEHVFGKLRTPPDGRRDSATRVANTCSCGARTVVRRRARSCDPGQEPHTVVHLRIVLPADTYDAAHAALDSTPSVCNIITLRGAAQRPAGDVILCDVAREEASVVIDDLRGLGIHETGSISLEMVDSEVSRVGRAAEAAAKGTPADAVIWEDVVARTADESTLSTVYLIFMIVAMIIAAVGIFLNSPILIVGAMVVGPEFGPVAGVCVGIVQGRFGSARRSLVALAVGFPLAISVTVLLILVLKATGVTPETFSSADHSLSTSIASPDVFAVIVAFCAGVAGMLSLTSAKSGALIGVLISVTTIPAAANVAVSFVYQDWEAWRGSQLQLALNLGVILIAGLLTLSLQRRSYHRRRARHTAMLAEAAGRRSA